MPLRSDPLCSAIALLRDELSWECANCCDEWATGETTLGREAKQDVVLGDRLRPALERLNPDLYLEDQRQNVE